MLAAFGAKLQTLDGADVWLVDVMLPDGSGLELVRRLRDTGAKRYYLQCFRDSGGLIGKDLHPVPRDELFEMRDAAREFLPLTELRGVD